MNYNFYLWHITEICQVEILQLQSVRLQHLCFFLLDWSCHVYTPVTWQTSCVCVSETLFPSVKFCNVIHPWHRQRSKGYGAEGSSAERTESCCFHSHNYWKTTAIWSEHEYLNTSPVSLAWLLVHSYLILRYKATRLMESCSLSHIKSGSGPLKSTKCDTQCLIKKKKKKPLKDDSCFKKQKGLMCSDTLYAMRLSGAAGIEQFSKLSVWHCGSKFRYPDTLAFLKW